MELDALVETHHLTWRRLETLTKHAPRSGPEADELVDLYQEVSGHLSLIRSQAPDPEVIAYLSAVLAAARGRTTGTRSVRWSGVADFFVRRFPAALYLTRRWWLTAMLVSYALTGLATWWLLSHPVVEQHFLDPHAVRQLVRHDFAGYYKQAAASHFAAKVWTNNAWVSALCIALGALGLPVIYLLFENMANVAVIGSLMIAHHRGGEFFGLILPHGLLELTAVFVAGGTGLRLFWSWVAPGDRTRAASFARQGRASVTVALGLVVVLLVSGLIEGFVTPSGLPTWARVGIGVLAETAFLAYVFVLGRRAAREGWTGDVEDTQAGDSLATVG